MVGAGPNWEGADWVFGTGLSSAVTREDASPSAAGAGALSPDEALPFEVLGQIGHGAMGVVYRAKDLTGRELAIKVVSGALSHKARARFLREGRLSAALDHPGIVKVFGGGEVEGRPYLACELIPGGRTLSDLEDELDSDRMLTVLVGVAEALGHAHSRGVVHRDVKPGNVLMTADGSPKVADFGLAWREGAESLTKSHAMLGTPHFMCPEQFFGVDRDLLGPPTDVWALGVMLYEALTGIPPFTGSNMLELGVAIREQAPRPPREIDRRVSRALNEVCLRALERKPEDRYVDGSAFALALREAIKCPNSLSEGWSSSWRRRPVRRRAVIAGLLAIVVGALLIVAFRTRGVVGGDRRSTARDFSADSAGAEVPSPPRAAQDAFKELNAIPRTSPGRLLLELDRWGSRYPDERKAVFHALVRDARIRASMKPLWTRKVRLQSEIHIASGDGPGTILARSKRNAGWVRLPFDREYGVPSDPTALDFGWRGSGRAWAAGRSLVVAAANNGVVSRFSVSTSSPNPRVLAKVKGPAPKALALLESRDLVAVGSGSTVHLFSLQTGESRGRIDCEQPVVGVEFSADGSRLVVLSTATGRWATHFRVWLVDSLKPESGLVVAPRAKAFACSPDGGEWAVGDDTGTLSFYDASSDEPKWTLGFTEGKATGQSQVIGLVFHSSELLLVLTKREVFSVDPKSRKISGTHFPRDKRSGYRGMVLTPDGSHLVLSFRGPDEGLQLWATPRPDLGAQ